MGESLAGLLNFSVGKKFVNSACNITLFRFHFSPSPTSLSHSLSPASLPPLPPSTHSLGGENLAVAQNTYAVLWFKGKELNMVFGLLLSVSRLVSMATTPIVKFSSLN